MVPHRNIVDSFFHDSSLFLPQSLCWGTRMPGPALTISSQVDLYHNFENGFVTITLKSHFFTDA